MTGTSIAMRTFRSVFRVLSFVAPGLAGRVATRIWFTPVLWSRSQPKPIPDGAEALHFEWERGTINGFRMGDGEKKALLVHGWAGSTRQYRRLATRLVREGFTCVVIDLPGHGPGSGDQTDVIEMTDVISATIGHMGKVDLLVAHSLGAVSAARALQEGVVAEAFVVIAPGVFPRRAFEKFCQMLNLRQTVADVVERNMDQRFGIDVFDRTGAEMLASEIPDRTLIVHDVEDEMVPIDDARELAKAWGAPLVEVSGFGHNGSLLSSAVIDTVVEFACEEGADLPSSG